MKPNRRQIALAMLAGALVLLAACTTPAETPLPADRTDHKFSVATDATNQFGLALFRQVAANASGGNVLLSPFSIQSALAMTYAGADGDTRAEMARVLHFPEDDAPLADSFGALRVAFDEAVKKSNDVQAVVINSYKNVAGIAAQQIQDLKMQYPGMPPQYLAEMQQQIEQSARENAKIAETIKPHLTELHVANRLFGQKDFEFRQPFLDLTRDRYGAQLQPLDFKTAAEAARGTINAWVSDQTKNRINDLIPADGLTVSTSMVLVNALYFKAPWQDKFNKQATNYLDFKVRGKEKAKVPTMYNDNGYGYAKRPGYTAVSLPYLGGDLQLLILLQDADNGVDALAAKVTPELLRSCAKLNKEYIRLWLPKLKFEPPTMKLADELKTLGLRTAFDFPENSANFDRMAPRKTVIIDGFPKVEYLAIAEVFHKTFFALDEESTEATAATAVVMATQATAAIMPGPPPPPPPEVHVDHPFLFAIQHRDSGVCLFLGRVTDPR